MVEALEKVFGDGVPLHSFEKYLERFLDDLALFFLLGYFALVLILVDRLVNQEG
jgi:hypothetical protein